MITELINVKLEEGTKAKLQKIADKEKRTLSNKIRCILEDYIDKKNK